MQPFYYRSTTNFGDAINDWLWERIFPGLLGPDDGVRLVGIGTLIKSELEQVRGTKVIFGSGAGYGSVPGRDITNKWHFSCVRGPLTADALGLDRRLAVTDSAWLVATLPEFSGAVERSDVIFVPHWTTATYSCWEPICRMAGVEYVDPLGDCKVVLQRLRTAKLAIVEAMHGAIMADCFRTPWIPVRTSPVILSFKWEDWCSSVRVPYSPAILPPTDVFDHLRQGRWPRGWDGKIRTAAATGEIGRLPERNAERRSGLRTMTQRVKPLARRMRSGVLSAVRPIRGWWPASAWNSRQFAAVAGTLDALKKRDPFLSEDAVRGELVERLQNARDRLIRDYPRLAESQASGETAAGFT